MNEAIAILQRMLADAERWRVDHIRAGRQIEAAGASIYIKALKDALGEVQAAKPT